MPLLNTLFNIPTAGERRAAATAKVEAGQDRRKAALSMLSALGPELAAAEARRREGKPKPTDSEILNVIKPQFQQLAEAAGLPDLDERTLIKAFSKGEQTTLSPGQIRVGEAGQVIAEGKPRQLPANEQNIRRMTELRAKSSLTDEEQIELDIRTTGNSLFERNLKRELDLEEKQIRALNGKGPSLTSRETSMLEKLRRRALIGQNFMNMLMQQSMGAGSITLQTPQQAALQGSSLVGTDPAGREVFRTQDGRFVYDDGSEYVPPAQ